MSEIAQASAQRFRAWADAAFAGGVPEAARAFSFNIYEHPAAFAVEVTGSAEYEARDSQWASHEVFAHRESMFEIPRVAVADSWELTLETVIALVRGYVCGSDLDHRLRRAEAIAVGFVDGDLHVLWEHGIECRKAP